MSLLQPVTKQSWCLPSHFKGRLANISGCLKSFFNIHRSIDSYLPYFIFFFAELRTFEGFLNYLIAYIELWVQVILNV